MKSRSQTTEADTKAGRLHEQALVAWTSANPTEAISLLKQAIALAPDVAIYHANLGVMLKDSAAPSDRIACYRRAIQLDPGNAAYLSNLVAALNAAGLFGEAEDAARHALALDVERQETWHNLASALGGQGKWTEAAAAYEHALSLNKQSTRTLVAAANAHGKAAQFKQAVTRFQQALEMPDLQQVQRMGCLRGVAAALVALGRGSEAARYLSEALAIAPDDMHLLIDLGNLEKRRSNFEEATRCYTKVLNLDPNCVEAVFNMGAVEQACGRHAEALSLYRRVIGMDPALPAVWNNLTACMTYSTDIRPQEIRAELEVFESLIARPLRENTPFLQSRNPGRILKVAYFLHNPSLAPVVAKKHHSRRAFMDFCDVRHITHKCLLT